MMMINDLNGPQFECNTYRINKASRPTPLGACSNSGSFYYTNNMINQSNKWGGIGYTSKIDRRRAAAAAFRGEEGHALAATDGVDGKPPARGLISLPPLIPRRPVNNGDGGVLVLV
jgi:hypothetical protein